MIQKRLADKIPLMNLSTLKKCTLALLTTLWATATLQAMQPSQAMEVVKSPSDQINFDTSNPEKFCHSIQAIATTNKTASPAKLVQSIKDQKIDINFVDNWNITTLMWAAYAGYPNVVRILINAGANLNHQSDNGFTALIAAAHKGHANIVKILIAAGAKRDVQEAHGLTALMVATRDEHLNVVQELSNHANLNKQNCKGITAMMIAVYKNNKDILQELLAKNADHLLQNNTGKTALEIAIGRGHLKIVKLLLDAAQRRPSRFVSSLKGIVKDPS